MADTTYSLNPSSIGGALQGVVSHNTRHLILQALQANGLLGNDIQIDVDVVPTARGTTVVDGHRDQVTIVGPNNDTLIVSNAPTIVSTSSGTNFVTLTNQPPKHSAAHGDTLIGGSGRDTLRGSTAPDSLRAGSGRESLISGGGADTLRGGGGRDTLVGGGRSYLVAGAGRATIVAGIGSSAFPGVPHDTVQAGSGRASIALGYGNNTVYAPKDGGSATVNAGTGSDTIYGPSAFQGAETINSAMGGHTTFHLGSGAVAYNLSSKSADTVFGGQGGFLNLNKATTDISGAAHTTVDGQSAVVYTFAGGGSVTAVGSVNITFTDTRRHG